MLTRIILKAGSLSGSRPRRVFFCRMAGVDLRVFAQSSLRMDAEPVRCEEVRLWHSCTVARLRNASKLSG